MNPTLVVMAAGLGSRFGGLKQLEPIGPNGEKIIDYTVYDAKRAGFQKVVFIIKKEHRELFDELIVSRIAPCFPVSYVYQSTQQVPDGMTPVAGREKPWGTGHAVWCCRETVREPFAVVNADDYYGPGAFEALADFLKGCTMQGGKAHYCMAGYVLENTLTEFGTVSRGVCRVDQDGYLEDVTEHTKIERGQGCALSHLPDGTTMPLALDDIVSMNCWGFTPDFFEKLEHDFRAFLTDEKTNLAKDEFYLPAVASRCIQDGSADVQVLKTADRWYGVTYQADKEAVAAAIRRLAQTQYPPVLWKS